MLWGVSCLFKVFFIALVQRKAIIEADNEMQRIKDKIGMFHEI